MAVLKDKVAIITGGSSGQGAEEARLFASEGAKVVIADIDEPGGMKVAQEIGASALFVRHDVANAANWTLLVDACVDRFGKVDILINNAGITSDLPIQDTDPETFERVLGVNLTGAYLGIRAVVDPMRSAGGGSIVNIASGAGLRAIPRKFAYGVSKWGLRGVTRYAAQDLGAVNIRINTILPGLIDTPMLHASAAGKASLQNLQIVPLGRIGLPGDVARTALFLASDQSSYITGAEITIDGGFSA